MIVIFLNLAVGGKYFCTTNDSCCSIVKTRKSSTAVLSNSSVSVLSYYNEPFSGLPVAMVSLSYFQFSQPNSSRSLSLRLQLQISTSLIIFRNINVTAPINFLVQFSYLTTTNYQFFLFQSSVVRTSDFTNSGYYYVILQSSSPMESTKCPCFLNSFEISNTSSSNRLGIQLSMILSNNHYWPIVWLKNNYSNAINLIRIHCVFIDTLELQSQYNTNSWNFYTAARTVSSPFLSSNASQYTELSVQYNSFIPGSTLVGILSFYHRQNFTTFSLGLDVNSGNRVVASVSKSNYPLHSNSIGTIFLGYTACAIYQYSCTDYEALSPDRTLCLSECPATFFNNSCGRCMPCHFTCLTCVGGNDYYQCLTCYAQLHRSVRVGSKGPCQCRIGFVGKTKQNTTCLPCHFHCSQCLVPYAENQCLSCANSKRTLVFSTCLCANNFITISSDCQPCAGDCQTCLGSVNFCTSCKEKSNLSSKIAVGTSTCITCGQNQQFNQKLQECLCIKNYTMVNDLCSFYGLTLSAEEQQQFQKQLKIAKQISQSQNVVVKSLIVLGANSVMLNFIGDSRFLKIHLLSNATAHRHLMLALMMLDSGNSPLQHWQQRYQTLFSPAELPIQAQSLPYFYIQFPTGRYLSRNVFDQLVSVAVFAVSLLGLLTIWAILFSLRKCPRSRLKLKRAGLFIKAVINRWPLQLFVIYYQSVFDITTKALAQITIGPTAPTIFYYANLFVSFLLLSIYLVIIVRVQILYQDSKQNAAYLIIFRTKLINFGVAHSLCHLLILLKPVVVLIILYFTPGTVAPLMLLVFCNLAYLLLMFAVRKVIKNYTLQQARHIFFVLFQCLLLAMHFEREYIQVWNILAYFAIALLIAIVSCGFVQLGIFIYTTIKKATATKRKLVPLKRSQLSLRNYKSKRVIDGLSSMLQRRHKTIDDRKKRRVQ